MEQNYVIRRHRGFTLTEIVVAVAIFATVMSGVAAVFISSLHASDAARAKLEIIEQFRAFSDFVTRDISCAYRSEDLDDRATFMGGPDRLAFITLTQNFGPNDADFSLITYYLLDDPESAGRPESGQFKRLIRLAIPLPYEAVEAFMSGYPRPDDEAGIELPFSPMHEPRDDEFFPSNNDLDALRGTSYAQYANALKGVDPRDRLFPGKELRPGSDPDGDGEVSLEDANLRLQALFGVLRFFGVQYGWGQFEWDGDLDSEMAPLIDDFELVTLVLAHEPGTEFGRVRHGRDSNDQPTENPLYPLRFRFGRINPREGVGDPPVLGPGGYMLSPRTSVEGRDVAFDNTVMYGVQDSWNAVAQGGPPEVVEVNMTFISKTRAVRDEPLAQPFYSLIHLPMAYDSGGT